MELAGLAFQVRPSAEGARGSDARVARSHAARTATPAQGTRAGDFPAGDSKKNFRDRLGSVEERYGCIQEHSGEHSIVDLCELLAVAKSGYYAWSRKAQSKQETMNEELSKMITEIFAEHRGRYGARALPKHCDSAGGSAITSGWNVSCASRACGRGCASLGSRAPRTAVIHIRSRRTCS